MPYWKATVERPNGAGGWDLVGVFGTPATSTKGTERHLSGETAFDAVTLLFGHVWPVNLQAFNQREDSQKWVDFRDAHTGIADHRITVEVDESNRWSVGYGKPAPEPYTMTVAELRLQQIRGHVTKLVEARAKVEEITEQLRRARADVAYHRHQREDNMRVSERAGVDPTAVAKAGRIPRKPRAKS